MALFVFLSFFIFVIIAINNGDLSRSEYEFEQREKNFFSSIYLFIFFYVPLNFLGFFDWADQWFLPAFESFCLNLQPVFEFTVAFIWGAFIIFTTIGIFVFIPYRFYLWATGKISWQEV